MAENNKLPAGRPVDKGKTRKIFDSVDLILETEGVSSLSMERIAREAGISKATLYRRFGSLKGVVKQYVANEVQPLFSHISYQKSDSGNPDICLEERLIEFGTELMKMISQRKIICFDNAILAAGSDLTEIKTELYQNGPARALQHLSMLLEKEKVSSEFLNIKELADVLFHLWRSGFYDQCKVKGICSLTDSELRAHICKVTRYFVSTISIEERVNEQTE